MKNELFAVLLLALTCSWSCDDDSGESDESLLELDAAVNPALSDAVAPDAVVPTMLPVDGVVALNDGGESDGGGVLGGPDAGGWGATDVGTFSGEVELVTMLESKGGYPVPAWLYRGGVWPTNMDGLLPIPESALAHRATNPDLWSEWRRTAEGIELKMQSGSWFQPPLDDDYAALPKGTTLEGTYTAPYDYSKTVKYRFAADGSFRYCSLQAFTSRREFSFGSSEVDGYVIRLQHYDDTITTLPLVHDPKTRPNSLWLAQTPYKRLNAENATTPLSCP